MKTLEWGAGDSQGLAAVAAMGVFDGVHLGHVRLFDRARRVAHERNLSLGAITFDELPAAYRDRNFGGRILSPAQRIELIEESGFEFMLLLPFDDSFRALDAGTFIQQLQRRFRVVELVVGENFRLGSDGVGAGELAVRGTASKIIQTGEREQVLGVDIVSLATHNDFPISSTGIRRLILLGRMEEAAALLGRNYRMDLRGLPLLRQEHGVRVQRNSIRQIVPAAGTYRCIAAVGNAKLETEVTVGKEEVSAVWAGSHEAGIEYLSFGNDVRN